MSDLTRRGFVKRSAVTAAGMTAIGAIAADVAERRQRCGLAGSRAVVAYVSDPSKGEISVMKGEREVVLRDRKLARDISRRRPLTATRPTPRRRTGNRMSSHREAPAISKDPVADNTDLYAFVSPDDPSTVTIIANYLPLRGPVRAARTSTSSATTSSTRSTSTTTATASRRSSTSSSSHTEISNKNTFLYNIGPITCLDSANWNRKQFYTVTRVDGRRSRPSSAAKPRLPAVQHRPALDVQLRRRSPPRRCTSSAAGDTVFAGQRLDPFYVDLGSIFDLGDLRPLEHAPGP